jgi:hypothetical protein
VTAPLASVSEVFCAASGDANNTSASDTAALVMPQWSFRPRVDIGFYFAW